MGTIKCGGRLTPVDSQKKELAIGIVLSGTGAHGTLGLREIKGRGGLTLAQDPDTAAYAQMPQNAIVGGTVDYVLPVEEMPGKLMSIPPRHALPDTTRDAP